MNSNNGLGSIAKLALAIGMILSPQVWAAAVTAPPSEAGAGPGMQGIESTAPEMLQSEPEFDIDIPTRAPLKAPADLKVTVNRFELSGNHLYSDKQLQALIGDEKGKELTFADLLDVSDRITKHYRDAGYIVARAYLPAQEIQNGVVKLVILEGQTGNVTASGENHMKPQRLAGHMQSLKDMKVVNRADLERGLLLINDLPGVKAGASLKPGSDVGTTDLDVAVTDTPRYTGAVDLSNFGSRYNGETRLGGTLQINNPFGYGDQFTIRPLVSDAMRTVYGSIGYSIPWGYNGTRFGARYSKMDSDVGKEFVQLGINNQAEVLSFYVTHPFVRSRLYNLSGQASFDLKDVKETWDPAYNADMRDRLGLFTFAISGDKRDDYAGGGLNNFYLGLVVGHESLDREAQNQHTKGRVAKLSFDVSRLQRTSADTSVYLRAAGQYTGDKLGSSEQFALGGPNAVRAYGNGEALGDNALLLTGEIRHALSIPSLSNYINTSSVYGFVDWGASTVNDPYPSEASTYHRAGAGLGVRFGRRGDYLFNVSYAAQIETQNPTSSSSTDHVWLQAIKWF